MAIKTHTGYPGAGKSHALVKDIIVPAILRGRRVVSNVSGLNWPAIQLHCLDQLDDKQELGELVTFEGEEALQPGFWPEGPDWDDSGTVIKRGDLIVFDEWALYFPNRGKWPDGERVKKFLAYHRHLAHPETGASIDVHIAAQLPTALHQDIRGLCELTYKYRKLRAAGFENKYGWYVWQGHLQPKNEEMAKGTSDYDPAIFPLYQSSSAAPGQHVELSTNEKDTIYTKGVKWGYGGGIAFLLCGIAYGAYSVTAKASPPEPTQQAQNVASGSPPPSQAGLGVIERQSDWRILGTIQMGYGANVMLERGGAVRTIPITDCQRDSEGMATSCPIDGATAHAEIRLGSPGGGSLLDGMKAR